MTRTRTTVALPTELLEGIDAAVKGGLTPTRNEFLAAAVRHELERIRREAVDREFEMMAEDPIYQRESREISEEHRVAGWEALRVAEDEP